MALIPCSPVDIWLDISKDTTLTEALGMLVDQLNPEAEDRDWLPIQKVFDVRFEVRNTYDDLKAKCSPDAVFGWLN